MDNQRIFMVAAIGFLSFFIYQKWVDFKSPQEVTPIEQVASSNVPTTPSALASGSVTNPSTTENVPSVTGQPSTVVAVPITENSASTESQKIRVETDLFVAYINMKGGDRTDES